MGQALPEGYQVQDFLGLCLVAAVIAAMVGGMAFGGREKLGTFPEIRGLPVPFEFVAYRVLLVALAMLALVAGLAVDHCHDILSNCPVLTAVPH